MHIKQIIIQGFKSYKEQTVIEPFSPGHNVIVGRNGSGKSNFFAAVRFVLSDAYTQLGREEKQALLHEGSGSAVMSAYVEIIFDNSDERFPTGKDEVIIRRTIGQIKDEYSLDRKSATKADVMNLLESAGFSRSNPYYIVPQGRVTTLTNMKDPERLTLLKEVAGTQVYEQRRAESLKIMDETDTKREKIDELLQFIEERLNELEEEKEELRGFQEKDREKRCLEYTIFHRESMEIASAIDQIEESRLSSAHNNDVARKQLQDLEAYIQNLDRELESTKQQVALYKSEKKQLELEKQTQVRERARIELETNDLREDENQNKARAAARAKDLEQLQNRVKQRKAELAKIMPQFEAKKAEEDQIRADLNQAENTKQRLLAKQGRNQQFKSKKDRDNYLNRECATASAELGRLQNTKASIDNEIMYHQNELQATSNQVEELRNNLSGRDVNMAECQKNLEVAKEKWNELSDERKEQQRNKRESDARLQTAKSELDKAEKSLLSQMNRETSKGLQTMRRVKDEMNLSGVYGTLAELCEVDDKFRTAVEATANNSLFNVVVDNDQTASKLIDALNARNGGRITCIPLNRLKSRNVKYPEANDAIPMMTRIKFDPKFQKAFEHVFSRTIICPSLEIASQYARSHGLSAITLDGSSSDKRGALTGGHHDRSRSRLQGYKQVSEARDRYQAELTENEGLKKALDALEQKITQATGDERAAQSRFDREFNSYGPMRNTLSEKTHHIANLKDSLAQSQQSLQSVEANIKNWSEQLAAHQNELASDFRKALSADEERTLEDAMTKSQTFRQTINNLLKERTELERNKRSIESEISENLERRIDQLQNAVIDDREGNVGSKKGSLKDSERELAKVSKSIAKLEKKLSEIDHNLEQSQAEIARGEESKASKQAEQAEASRTIEKLQKKLEKGLSKKAMLNEKAADCQRNIRDLGVLPDEAFEKYEKHTSDALVKRLHKVQEALKKFSHVNKKAFEQYNNFTKQRNTLITRREELDTSRKSIEELINVLDQRKDEAIERTFKQVSKNFKEIFEKLVPAGAGRLIIQRKVDKSRRPDVDDESDEEGGGGRSRDAIENYTGVGIAVSFNSKHDDQQRIQQLSGGQKSLCALALVFSIQQCDPAPFYLFDEIDANLDAQYRTAVAQMVKTLSAEGGQFICTTFRREMVLDADQHYGVTFENKMSSIDLVSRNEALNFVDGQKQ